MTFSWPHASRLFIQRHQFPNCEFRGRAMLSACLCLALFLAQGCLHRTHKRGEPAKSFLTEKIHHYKDQRLSEQHEVMRT